MSTIRHTQRSIRALSDPATVRTEMYLGIEHVVVPVIALVGDTVIQAQGSIGPELVPGVELAQAPWQWNGRAILPDHPKQLESANTPSNLETQAFGIVFNSRYEDNKLKMDAYLNPIQAEKVGKDAVGVIDRCRQGLQVEVSVGAAISIEIRQGITSTGVSYDGIWGDIISDHLAMLPEGIEGACNNNMGCGAPRAAADNSEKGDTIVTVSDKDDDKGSTKEVRVGTKLDDEQSTKSTLRRIAERVVEHFRLPSVDLDVRVAEDASFSKIYNAVWDALMDLEPGFDGIYDLFDDYVVYAVYVSSGFHLYRRDYTYNESTSEVSFRDALEVQQVVEYKVIAASGDKPCGCKDKAKNKGKVSATSTDTKGDSEVGTKEEVKAEGSDTATPTPTPVAETPAVETKVESTPSETVQLSKVEYESMKEALGIVQAQQAAKKAALVARLNSATVQTVYDQKALEGLTIQRLEEVARLCRVDAVESNRSASIDYSNRGLPSSEDSPDFTPAPDSYREAIKRQAEVQKTTN